MSETMTIRYLSKEEKSRTRAMYEANFPEDTESFVDYYYTYKTTDNRILVMENAGKPEVMIHLNPYAFRIFGQPALVNYVVAVATDVSVRRQGKMTAVMERALSDMAKEHQPFTFLIPANPDVYRSGGFAFVDSEDYADCKAPGMSACRNFLLRRAETSDIPAMAHFANVLLAREYDIFPEHTEVYYRRMMAEMACQDGGLVLLVEKHAGQIHGIFSYGRDEARAELQELLVEAEYRQELLARLREWQPPLSVPEMHFMFRILDLRTLVPMLCSRESCVLKVQVLDRILPENAGAYEIVLDRAGGSIADITAEETECIMDIAELTQYLFDKTKIFTREWV